MKLEKRFTSVHQSMTFSRRMMLMRGAQLGIGGLLLGRLGWLSVAENEKYSLESESNRVQLIIVPPRRGWILDRNNQPLAINRSDFRVDLIPQQLKDAGRIVPQLARLLQLDADEMDRLILEHRAALLEADLVRRIAACRLIAAFSSSAPRATPVPVAALTACARAATGVGLRRAA